MLSTSWQSASSISDIEWPPRHHLEQLLLTGEQCFGPLPVVDVGLQYVPADDTALGIPERQTAHMEPAIDAVSTAHAVLDVVWFPGVYRSLPGGDHHGKIIRMNGVAGRPAFQFFERCAEVFQDMAVDVFDFAGRRHESDQGRNAVGDRAIVVLAGAPASSDRLRSSMSVLIPHHLTICPGCVD